MDFANDSGPQRNPVEPLHNTGLTLRFSQDLLPISGLNHFDAHPMRPLSASTQAIT
ncbi:hypothetical protein H8S90_15055 [Olivibacter sp. SDN3]|uniref:hypothetical protein n=1 Tax=Olivibacter sp. SDN3 TaxID=2764720 RepID=UPI001650F0E9|nr:hypothetical protein [Olivibacter sp. SDN3]QNL48124.1 hypothetical protein H8S90_15055 [Olivibacter sp. SDN3]